MLTLPHTGRVVQKSAGQESSWIRLVCTVCTCRPNPPTHTPPQRSHWPYFLLVFLWTHTLKSENGSPMRGKPPCHTVRPLQVGVRVGDAAWDVHRCHCDDLQLLGSGRRAVHGHSLWLGLEAHVSLLWPGTAIGPKREGSIPTCGRWRQARLHMHGLHQVLLGTAVQSLHGELDSCGKRGKILLGYYYKLYYCTIKFPIVTCPLGYALFSDNHRPMN